MSDPKPTREIQEVKVKCPCGRTHVFNGGHYDRVIMSCGRPYWILQPKRAGQFVLFPWPGPNLTRAEMETQSASV